MLGDEGYELTAAATGAEAAEAISGERPQLVLLDLSIPGLDPEAFCHELAGRHGAVPILIVSGAIDSERAAERLGASFLAKPFELDNLVATVRKLLRPG